MDYFSEANKLYNLKEYNKAIDLFKIYIKNLLKLKKIQLVLIIMLAYAL